MWRAVQGSLVVGQASLESRLLGLVESGGRCLICVYSHCRMAIAAEDLCLERVLRLEEGFALEEGSDVTIRIVSPEANLLVRLPFGSQTQMFLREVKKRCVAGGSGPGPEAWRHEAVRRPEAEAWLPAETLVAAESGENGGGGGRPSIMAAAPPGPDPALRAPGSPHHLPPVAAPELH
ncbi:hypothetical protein E2320_000233 [Naja naja]|nr:hypothetical protein E2320_000233 [Naja naja]